MTSAMRVGPPDPPAGPRRSSRRRPAPSRPRRGPVAAAVETTLATRGDQIRQFAFDGDWASAFASADPPGPEDHFTLVLDQPVTPPLGRRDHRPARRRRRGRVRHARGLRRRHDLPQAGPVRRRDGPGRAGRRARPGDPHPARTLRPPDRHPRAGPRRRPARRHLPRPGRVRRRHRPMPPTCKPWAEAVAAGRASAPTR